MNRTTQAPDSLPAPNQIRRMSKLFMLSRVARGNPTMRMVLVMTSRLWDTWNFFPSASALEIPEPSFRRPVVNVLESHPVRFVLVFEQQMPTPGWRTEVDSVEVDEGRIVVKITAKPPEGIVAQVITPAQLRVPLGSLKQGRYVLELRIRRDEAQAYQIAHVLVVVAS